MVEPISIASAVASFARLFLGRRSDVLEYTKQRFIERDGKWRIRIIHPTKSITKCKVLVNGIALISSTHGDSFEHTIETGGGDNFINGESIPDNSKIEIKSNGKSIWKGKFSDLELSKP